MKPDLNLTRLTGAFKRTAQATTLAAGALILMPGAADAGSQPSRGAPMQAQSFVSDAAKYGFNPQPEPPPGLEMGIHSFNPQPEPPPGPDFNARGFNPQPEPPAEGGAGGVSR